MALDPLKSETLRVTPIVQAFVYDDTPLGITSEAFLFLKLGGAHRTKMVFLKARCDGDSTFFASSI